MDCSSLCGIKSNPFDAVLHLTISLAREFVYMTERYGSLESSRVGVLLSSIEEQFNFISSLPDDVVELLKNESYIKKYDLLEKVNSLLFALEQAIPTESTSSSPLMSGVVDSIINGNDVAIRHQFLLALTKYKPFSNRSFLEDILDYLNFGVTSYIEVKEVSDRYNFSKDDVEFMIDSLYAEEVQSKFKSVWNI